MTGHDDNGDGSLDVFVSLPEAALAYVATVGTLRSRARAGGLRAYKVPGIHGHEWRVSLRSVASAGFRPRIPAPTAGGSGSRVQELETELAVVRRRLVAEQRRADRADQELGHALLEVGRLRASVSRAVDHT